MMHRRASRISGLIVFAALLSLAAGSLHYFYHQRDRLKSIVRAHARQYMRHYVGRKFAGDTTYRDDDDEATVVRVFVDPTRRVARVNPRLFGVNLSPATETEKDVADFVGRAGITCFRFPGKEELGYHWETGVFDLTGRFDRVPLRNMDYFVRFCRSTGTKPIIRVNVASGTPEEAAAWVEYLNKTVVFPAVYWELGEEVNGEQGIGRLTPEAYADRIVAYAAAMKKVAPNIRVGMAWAPGTRPFDNKKIVKRAGQHVDFVSFRWYPNLINPDNIHDGRIHPYPLEVMANSEYIPGMVEEVKRLFEKYVPDREKPIEVAFLEWDGAMDGPGSDEKPYSQGIVQWSLANALFTLDCLGMFARTGVDVSTACDLQSTAGGLIRGRDKDIAGGGERWDGETVRPRTLALELFAKHFGDTVVASTVTGFPFYYAKDDWWPETFRGRIPYVSAYAGILEGKGKCSLLLINKHPEKSYKIRAVTHNVNIRSQGKVYLLTGPSLLAQNEGNSLNVQLKEFDVHNIEREMDFTLPAHSAMLIQMDIEYEKAQ